MARYLGTMNSLITNEELLDKLSIDASSLYFNGDIEFMKFSKNDKLYLIPSKPLRTSISRTALDTVSSGLDFNLNGHSFTAKLMTGMIGEKYVSEWDEFIVDNSDYLKNIIDVKKYTWCKDVNTNVTNKKAYVTRGYDGDIGAFNHYSATTSNLIIGFRPILTVNKNKPFLSIDNQDLGKVVSCIAPITYTVENSGCNFTITEKLDGEILRSSSNQASGSAYTLDLSKKWENLSYGKHRLEIIATDIFDVSSTVVITFRKGNLTPLILPNDSTLSKAITQVGVLNEELSYQCATLKDYLSEKRVNILNINKLSDLISKVGDIDTETTVSIGNCNHDLYTHPSMGIDISSDGVWKDYLRYPVLFKGEVRLTCLLSSSNVASRRIRYTLYNKYGEVKSTNEILLASAGVIYYLDIVDIKPTDVLVISIYHGTSGTVKMSYFKLLGDVKGWD